jgi:hypothetical protein
MDHVELLGIDEDIQVTLNIFCDVFPETEVPDVLENHNIPEVVTIKSLTEISEEVAAKFFETRREIVSWENLESEPFSIRVGVFKNYQIHSTILVEEDALYYIIHEALKHNGEKNKQGSPLNTQEQIQLIKYAIDYGIDINRPYPILNAQTADDSNVPLSQATSYDNLVLMEFLIGQGAEVKPCVLRAVPNCIFLSADSQIKTIQFLIKKGIDINIYDDLGGIMHTSYPHYESHCEFLVYLLENGLNPEIIDKDGKSLLHINVEQWVRNKSFALISYGADLYKLDYKGNTPLDLTQDMSFKSMLEDEYKGLCCMNNRLMTKFSKMLFFWSD